MVGSCRILKKAGEWRLQSLFLFWLKQKSDRKLTEFFSYVVIVIIRTLLYINYVTVKFCKQKIIEPKNLNIL